MATAAPKQLGITPPLSTALPTDAEKKATDALIEELTRQNNFESRADTDKRTAVLASLQTITEEFVKRVCRKQKKPENYTNAAGGRIFTYGSFRLGVYGPGSDIDTLVVVPKNVSREEYFEMFPDLLVEMAPKGSITELTPVPDAFVPIIKFEYSGISIDLIFASIDTLSQVPRTLTLKDDNILTGLDEAGLRSLNGTRVTDDILDLVPEKAVFRNALRGIKLWAQRRAIYANIMGFPGGVAWAMLVARVCQLYPQATASTIILKFFRIMEKWQWPQPVLLQQIKGGKLNVRVWNPRVYKADSFHLMPIITPSYPSMCATHNITNSTKEIICRELARGGNIVDRIMMGKAPWKDLFEKHTFFTQNYKYYLSVISASTTKEAQLIWAGLVESKVRLLVTNLEVHNSIAIAHPFNKGFERVHKCSSEDEIEAVKEGGLQYQINEIPTVTTDPSHDPSLGIAVKDQNVEVLAADKKETMVYTTTFYIGLELHEGEKSLDIAWCVDEFKRICRSWDKYDEELNTLSVIHTRNCDLPDDVFTEGEVKPTRSQRRKKRGLATDDARQAPAKRQQVVTTAG
ncbi:polynucleotide adenylyltransferase [Ciborinia camelliae]|nr:polynucleotide adenylyltransferase [Ciborinia camelliae]